MKTAMINESSTRTSERLKVAASAARKMILNFPQGYINIWGQNWYLGACRILQTHKKSLNDSLKKEQQNSLGWDFENNKNRLICAIFRYFDISISCSNHIYYLMIISLPPNDNLKQCSFTLL
jgi:hypothetical protein